MTNSNTLLLSAFVFDLTKKNHQLSDIFTNVRFEHDRVVLLGQSKAWPQQAVLCKFKIIYDIQMSSKFILLKNWMLYVI